MACRLPVAAITHGSDYLLYSMSHHVLLTPSNHRQRGLSWRGLQKQSALYVQKTGSALPYHIAVAISVAYAVTGDFASSLTLSLLEPSVQAVVYFVHERFWSSEQARRRCSCRRASSGCRARPRGAGSAAAAIRRQSATARWFPTPA